MKLKKTSPDFLLVSCKYKRRNCRKQWTSELTLYGYFTKGFQFFYPNLGDVKNLHRQKIRLLNKKQQNQFFDHCKWFLLIIKLIGLTVGLITWMVFPYFILQKAKVKLKLFHTRFMKPVNLSSSDYNVLDVLDPMTSVTVNSRIVPGEIA